MAYKKQLSVFELQALVEEHKESAIFRANRKGERTLEPWLRGLRFKQALQIAESILAKPIDHQEFQECWKRTRTPKAKPTPSEPPNTATFGGYRLRQRPALDRDKKQTNQPKKKK